ncbi:MAG: DUF2797 domain-containing protein [Tenacibaculum sp.]
MQYKGVLKKMATEYLNPVQYYLDLEFDFININQLLNKTLTVSFIGSVCLNCNLDREPYRQGFCRQCFFKTARAGNWIMRPELSKAHLGQEDRDLEYEKKMQLQAHVVYLANSSNIKVGVTRKSQIPTRWIDQGAHKAIEIVEVPNRYLAGITELALKKHLADKTNWRKMLRNESENENLLIWQQKLRPFIPAEVQDYIIANNKETNIEFPVEKYPKTPKTLNLTKQENYRGKLVGIKGQYLIFEDETVFNIRAYEGWVLSLVLK